MSDLVVPNSQQGRAFADTDGISIRPGSWWECKDEWKGLPAGTVMLCTDAEIADGEVHVIHLLAPPSALTDKMIKSRSELGTYSILTPAFLAAFVSVSNEEAMRRREMEKQAVLAEMQRLQDETVQAQARLSDLSAMPAPVLGSLAGPDALASGVVSIGTDLVAAQARDMQADITAQVAVIEEVRDVVTANVTAMQNTSMRLSGFYSEQAKAAIASTKPLTRSVARLQESLHTTGLYLGTGLWESELCDGPGAPAGTPLTMLQRRLYMDEELAIHLAQEEGGADYSNVRDFAQALKADPALVERIFGAPRAVVAMAYRRNEKDYPRPDMGAEAAEIIKNAFESVEKDAINKQVFLLVRDGGRIWMVGLPSSISEIPRLFPTPDDLEAPYTEPGWFREKGTTIGPDSLNYAKATEQFRQLALQYERVLVVLWGLHDRLGLFGDITKGAEYKNFIDPRLQQEKFRLIWDDQNLLGTNRPGYREWVSNANSALRSGSRVAVMWRRAMTPESCPTGAEADEKTYRIRLKLAPQVPFSVAVARREENHFIVDCPVSKDIYPRHGASYERLFNTPLDLTEYRKNDYSFAFLVLDTVDPDDVDYYLRSRSDREHYLDHVPILVAVRDLLREEMKQQAPGMAILESAVTQGKLPEPAGGWAPHLRKVVREWRTENKGALLPEVGTAAWKTAQTRLLTAAWFSVQTEGNTVLAEQLQQADQEMGNTPIRLARDSRSRLILYSRPGNDEERTRSVEMVGHWPFLRRTVLEVSASGTPKPTRHSTVPLSPALLSAEATVADYAPLPVLRSVSRHPTFSNLDAALKTAQQFIAMPSPLLETSLSEDRFCELITLSLATAARNKDTMIRFPHFFLPVGTVFSKSNEDKEVGHLSMFGISAPAWSWLALNEGSFSKNFLNTITRRFGSKKYAVEYLQEVRANPIHARVSITSLSPKRMEDMQESARSGVLFLPQGTGTVRQRGGHYDNGLYVTPADLSPADLLQAAVNKEVGFEKTDHVWHDPEALARARSIV